jgi:flagellar basal-body rod protein FlgG
VQVGTGTRVVSVSRDFSPGSVQYTGDELNVAINGDGFFVVESQDGIQRFTRDGHFTLNADGELVTASGHLVSPGIQIPEGTTITIAEDGTVSVTYVEDPTDPVSVGTIELVDFANPGGLQAVGSNMYLATPASGEAIPMDSSDGSVSLQQGFLEASNVDVAEELVSMIVAQRAFELTSKVMETADETMQTVTNLKR